MAASGPSHSRRLVWNQSGTKSHVPTREVGLNLEQVGFIRNESGLLLKVLVPPSDVVCLYENTILNVFCHFCMVTICVQLQLRPATLRFSLVC